MKLAVVPRWRGGLTVLQRSAWIRKAARSKFDHSFLRFNINLCDSLYQVYDRVSYLHDIHISSPSGSSNCISYPTISQRGQRWCPAAETESITLVWKCRLILSGSLLACIAVLSTTCIHSSDVALAAGRSSNWGTKDSSPLHHLFSSCVRRHVVLGADSR